MNVRTDGEGWSLSLVFSEEGAAVARSVLHSITNALFDQILLMTEGAVAVRPINAIQLYCSLQSFHWQIYNDLFLSLTHVIGRGSSCSAQRMALIDLLFANLRVLTSGRTWQQGSD